MNPSPAGFEPFRESFAGLFIEDAPVATAGDIIHLCAGACDGVGTAVYPLEGSDCFDGGQCSTTHICVMHAEVEGPITIEPYCENSTCETVILTGDSNFNNQYDAGEPEKFLDATDCDGGNVDENSNYFINGDPDGDGIPNLIIEKFRNHAFYLSNNANGWNISGVEIRYLYDQTYRCTGANCDNVPNDGVGTSALGCVPADTAGTAFTVNRQRGTLTMDRNHLHHICSFGYRLNNNCVDAGGNPTQSAGCTTGPVAINIDDNQAWNIYGFANYHQAKNVNFRRNELHDINFGIQSEEQTKNILVEDNIVGCDGAYNVNDKSSQVRCSTGIAFVNGDNSPEFGGNDGCADTCADCPGGTCSGACVAPCFSTGNIVRRNVVYGNGMNGSGGSLSSGIFYENYNSGGADTTVIENNTVSRVQRSNSCNLSNVSNRQETAMAIRSKDAILVQNNTIVDSGCPVSLDKAPHTFINNIIARAYNGFNSSDQRELYIFPDASGGLIDFNYISPVDGSVAPICVGATETYSGSCSGGSSIACANPLVYGAGNVCTTTGNVLQSCQWSPFCATIGGTAEFWDLHAAADSIVIDIGTTGATDDMDKQSRPFGAAFDIGADEARPLSVQAPSPAVDAAPPAPAGG